MKKFRTILICGLVFCNSIAIAQNDSRRRIINVNRLDETIQASILLDRKMSKGKDDDLDYYWYKSNEIHVSRGDYDGKLLDGLCKYFYLNNNLKSKGNFKKGLINGKWIKWHQNGKIESIYMHKLGIKHGRFKRFDENGRLLEEGNYRSGKLHGRIISLQDSAYVPTYYRKGIIRAQSGNIFSKLRLNIFGSKSDSKKDQNLKDTVPKEELKIKSDSVVVQKNVNNNNSKLTENSEVSPGKSNSDKTDNKLTTKENSKTNRNNNSQVETKNKDSNIQNGELKQKPKSKPSNPRQRQTGIRK